MRTYISLFYFPLFLCFISFYLFLFSFRVCTYRLLRRLSENPRFLRDLPTLASKQGVSFLYSLSFRMKSRWVRLANSLLMGDEVLSNIMRVTNNGVSKNEWNPTVDQMHRGSCSSNHKRHLSLAQGREKPRHIPNLVFN